MAAKKTANKRSAKKTSKPTKAAAKPAKAKAGAKAASGAKPAKAAGAKRTVPKTSPLKGMSVDAWVKAKTSGWHADVVKRCIAVTMRAAPDATVSIKWAQPVFELNGPFAFIKPATAHVTFGFWRGAELGDPAGVLEGGERMKHVKITKDDPLNEARIATLVREAASLNRAKGDPTKRP